jgi:hypothetical protein
MIALLHEVAVTLVPPSTVLRMEQDGLVERHAFQIVPPRVEYTLTH